MAVYKARRVTERTMTWMEDGRCTPEQLAVFHPDVRRAYFFADAGPQNMATRVNIAAAKGVCLECPIRVECLDWALDHWEHGIWGGTDTRQRKAIRRQQRRRAAG